jgi:hypothetical protein
MDPEKLYRLILRYLNTSNDRLQLVSEKLEVLLERTEEISNRPTVMITTDCNETFASENQKNVNEVDFLRTFQQLNRGIQQRTFVNIDLVNEILKRNLEDSLPASED